MNFRIRFFSLLVFTLSIFICAKIVVADDEASKKNEKEVLKFQINLKPNLSLKKNLVAIADEMAKAAKLYKTTNQKVYWENEAKKSFLKLLYSYGYYASNIDVDIQQNSDIITFNIDAGVRYSISSITLKHAEHSNQKIKLPELSKLTSKKNHFILARNVINDQNWLLKYIEKNNCLLSLSVSHLVTVNHLKNNVDIVFFIEAGPTATIKDIEFRGLDEVNAEYVRKLVHLDDGQCFKRSYITEARGYLQKSNLFSSTTPKIPKNVDPDGSVPVIFNLIERKSRSLKAGLNYGTDTGFGLGLGWEHRNFFGSGEEVRLNVTGNKKEQLVELNYEKPFFKRDDQTLRFENSYENGKTKAYDSKEAAVAVLIDRQLTPEWKAGLGLKFSHAEIKHISNNQAPKKFDIISVPLFAGKDTRNNILNATKGYNITLDIAPLVSIDKKNRPFFKTKLTGTTYLTNKDKIKTTLALKASVGTIAGIKSEKIPSTEKFFVGGGSSVRGYAYQFAGNMDSEKKPLGGKSFVETGVELRLNVTEDIGVVAFIDSGYAYDSFKTKTKQKLLHGYGIGFRYITGFGPLRADIGFPLKRRKEYIDFPVPRRKFIDKSFQFYFGIGQAF